MPDFTPNSPVLAGDQLRPGWLHNSWMYLMLAAALHALGGTVQTALATSIRVVALFREATAASKHASYSASVNV